MRWRLLYEPVVQDIIRLFKPNDPHPVDMLRTSLQRLARDLGADVDTTRAALTALAQREDFTVSADPDQFTEYHVFEIRVDWDVFARSRISVGLDLQEHPVP
ncbi:hypothetical protein SAMN05216188_11575 [Lentzea xinjiangensis]|uniref:Uncharacterized protein n=1 Tax=Lentzea xinjiangensis TaxID=402600 RepID=A0A1H9RWM5_9PSEU|nr:hypothetical protein SAMN05216188_11575 [Lentzea xinjiangensis]